MSNWQPIETAPKNDTPIIVFDGEIHYNMRRVKLDKTNIFYTAVRCGASCVRDATHWMPLPEPPK